MDQRSTDGASCAKCGKVLSPYWRKRCEHCGVPMSAAWPAVRGQRHPPAEEDGAFGTGTRNFAVAMVLMSIRMVWDTARWADGAYQRVRAVTHRGAALKASRAALVTVGGLLLLYVGYVALLAAVAASIVGIIADRVIPPLAFWAVVALAPLVGIAAWIGLVVVGRRSAHADPSRFADLVLALSPLLLVVLTFAIAIDRSPR